jgi:hypothetical protein
LVTERPNNLLPLPNVKAVTLHIFFSMLYTNNKKLWLNTDWETLDRT